MQAKTRPGALSIFCCWLSRKWGSSGGRWGTVVCEMDQAGAERAGTAMPGLTPRPKAL